MSAAQFVALTILVGLPATGALCSWLWGEGVFAELFVFVVGVIILAAGVATLGGMAITGAFPWQEGFWA